MVKRFLIVGPPGSGKGTQSGLLQKKFGIVAISTGDIFRANVKEGTELGRQAKIYIDKGNFVPDSITNAMVRDRLGESDTHQGFVLDGYPRTVAQVEELDSILGDAKLDAVVQLVVDNEALVRRLLTRAAEEGRNDDNERVVRHRLDLYEKQTAPVVEIYRRRGLVIALDGSASIEIVSYHLMQRLSFLEKK